MSSQRSVSVVSFPFTNPWFAQIPSVMDRSGYMAPEYAMNGYLSTKTDVFSFGILVLEIVSGRKNIVRHSDDEKIDLLNYVSARIILSKREASLHSSLCSKN